MRNTLRPTIDALTRARRLVALLILPTILAVADGPGDWHVPDASLRFNIRIASVPTDPRAGIVAVIPDGGLLPRPYPNATVVDRAGSTLPSECVWHNPGEGFAVVFERPTVGYSVWIYVGAGQRINTYNPNTSSFKPSLMAYVQPVAANSASLDGARRIAGESPPGQNARFALVGAVRSRNNPVWRNDRHFVTYYSGWLNPPRAGATWLATVSQDGSQVLVDGRNVATWPAGRPRSAGQRGQFGGTVNFSDDIHRLEYFHFQNSGPVEMLLAWRLPGRGSDDLPDEITRAGYIHSGQGEMLGVESRTGAPVPLISAERINHLWLFDQPIYLARFSGVFARNNPPDTRYTWRIDDGPEITEREFMWLIEGNRERTIRMQVASDKGTAQATRPFYLRRNTRSASINDPDQRQAYRAAFLNMCRLLPPGVSPAAQWSGDMWNTLIEVLEPYKGRELLIELFDRSRDDIVAMPEDLRYRLEDYFFEVIRYTDRDAATPWLRRLRDESTDRDRRLHWQLTEIDFLLYDLHATNDALRIVSNLKSASGNPEVAIRALIREGDIARLAGDFEEAQRIYSRAQDRAGALRRSQRTRQTMESAGSALRGADAIREAREARQAETLRSARAARFRVQDWRVMAVRGSVHYETVRNLIRTGYLFEARDALAEWEFEFPLHKIAEDLLIAEAEFYITIGNYARAQRLLANYRKGIDMTNFLPMAMQMELECLLEMQRDDAIRELADEIERRLPNHPIAQRAKDILTLLEEEG